MLLALLCCVLPVPASAQRVGRSIELFGTVGGVAGVMPVHAVGAAHLGMHAGFRFDGGVQGERLGVGLGMRVWGLAPTSSFGGQGLDVFMQGEWRSGRDARTTFRATAGASFNELDQGRGEDRENVLTQGFEWSVGVGREVIAPSGALLLLSADLVFPHVNPDIDGRRKPVLELGFGYRSRWFQFVGIPAM